MELDIDAAVSPYYTESAQGFDVDTTKLPEGLTVIRFYNAW